MKEIKYLRTVTGKCNPNELLNPNIKTLPYEHIIQNLCNYIKAEENYIDIKDPIELKSLFKLYLKPFSTYDNLSLEADSNKASNELMNIKSSHLCHLICDVTTVSHGQNLKCLREISKYTNIKICQGLTLDYSYKDVKAYLNAIKYELNYGFEDQIPSFIGEVFITDNFPSERENELFQVLIGLINEYDIPIFVKLNSMQKDKATNTIIPYLNTKEIRTKTKWVFSISLSDQDDYEKDFELISEIVKSGYSIVLCTYECDLAKGNNRLDQYYNKEKAAFLKKTLNELRGFIKHFMVSNNINFKVQLKEYGGFGYENIFINYIDEILQGLNEEEKACVLKTNLLSLLSWWQKPRKNIKEVPMIKCEKCGSEKEESNTDVYRKFDKTFCSLFCLKKFLAINK